MRWAIASRPRRLYLRPRDFHCYGSKASPRTGLLGAGHSIFNQTRASAPSPIYQWQLSTPQNLQALWQRGAKRKSTLKLRELPQGPLGGGEELPPLTDNDAEYPTVVQQARNNMRRFSQCILLTRVGSFYELYFEHADEMGPLLGLKVARKRTSAGSVSMAGFPFYQLDRFLKILVQDLGRYVAISEEYHNPEKGGLMFDRRVSRIITPGTLIDEKFMNPYENNFLLAVASPPTPALLSSLSTEVGLAWLDLSTGDFFTQESTVGMLSGDIARIGPREVVLRPKDPEIEDGQKELSEDLRKDGYFITYHPVSAAPGDPTPLSSVVDWKRMLETSVPEDTVASLSVQEIQAGNLLLDYAQARLPGMHMKLQPPIRKTIEDTMLIDANSMRNLEIKITLRERLLKGSLLHTVKRTVTKSGARLLANWLTSPVTFVSVIDSRLNLVEMFLYDISLREDVLRLLKRSHDSQRIVQKFSLGRGNADDLIALARTIEVTRAISELLSKNQTCGDKTDSTHHHWESMEALLRKLDVPLELAERIAKSIDEEGLMKKQRIEESEVAEMVQMAQEVTELDEESKKNKTRTKASRKSTATVTAGKRRRMLSQKDAEKQEAWIMQKSASRTLQTLHKRLEKLERQKNELEERLQTTLGAQSLSLRWTPGLGHICHVKGKDMGLKVSKIDRARTVSASRSTMSFHLPEWTELGCNMDLMRQQIRGEEQEVFRSIREDVIKVLVKLRRNASVLDQLDVACSFATLAQEQDLVRPILNLGVAHKVVGGRHSMVEAGLQEKGRTFTPNDCFVGDKERLWLVTGPNMAGKSTFLRQNALISILAQIGSFVPAEHAEIGIVDRIFSRVGSADNLFRDQSTFMVEMLETAQILKQATPRSFVIMDEVGRGTTPVDGLAIAYACLHHLYTINRSRALFATHFHQLGDMVAGFDNVGCYCTDLDEAPDGSFTYVHKLRKGVNTRSHALKVARLAGIPESTIRVAEEILSRQAAADNINSPLANTGETEKPVDE